MSMQARGGIPRFWTGVATDAGRYHQFPALTIAVKIQTDADVKVYATEADFTNDANGRVIAAAAVPEVEPMEVRGLYFRKTSAGNANLTVTSYHRKG